MWHRQVLGVIALGIALVAAGSAQDVARVDFARDVQPILKQRCYGCHGPSHQENNFRLDRRSAAMRGGTIAVIGPGNSAGSRLFLRLTGNDFGPQMPPAGPLSPAQISTIKAWIDQGAEWPDDLAGEEPRAVPDPAATTLMKALRDGDATAFRTLAAAEPGAGNAKGPAGSTPLMHAVLYGDATAVKRLLDAGANPNIRNAAGATALMWAVTDLEKTRLLLEHGADVNAQSADQRTPLLVAAGLPGGSAVVRLLVDRGADVEAHAAGGAFGETTPLTEAAYAGDAATFLLLVERGADVKAEAPLLLALSLYSECAPCAQTLLSSANLADLGPAMTLTAPPNGPALAFSQLLERGASASVTDLQGRTVLMLAAASDAVPVDAAKSLIARGVDVNAVSPTGETAIALAKLRGNTALVDLLLKAGAKDAAVPAAPAAKPVPAASLRAAVERSVPLLQDASGAFLKKSGCVSCHHNSLASMAVAMARSQGVRVDEEMAQDQQDTVGRYLETWRERALQGAGIPGDSDTVSYILLGLSAEGYPSDEATDAMARFVARQQTPSGRWHITAHRPPIESEDVEVTAVSMRALQVYAPKSGRAPYEEAIRRAAAWLAKAEPHNTESRAFQLLGLDWSKAGTGPLQRAARALTATQRPDGGWPQLPTLPSDAYATGQALFALVETGALPATDPVYQRGARFLLNSQFEDGSWFVKSRAIPVQPHFETGFPFGHDQFISAAASNWATMALALGINPKP